VGVSKLAAIRALHQLLTMAFECHLVVVERALGHDDWYVEKPDVLLRTLNRTTRA